MSLLNSLVQLLQNTVASVNLSLWEPGGNSVLQEETLLEWAPPAAGIFKVDLYAQDGTPRALGVLKNNTLLFAPATVTDTLCRYTLQVVLLSSDSLKVSTTSDYSPGSSIRVDLIITQIG